VGLVACCILTPQLPAADNNGKPLEKAPEEVLLEKIEQLQGQIDELRAAVAALHKQQDTRVAAAAPATETAAVPPATAAVSAPAPAEDQQVPRQPKAGLQQSTQPEKRPLPEPFSFGDFTWLTGNPRTKDSPLETKAFTGEFRADVAYVKDLNHPQDDSITIGRLMCPTFQAPAASRRRGGTPARLPCWCPAGTRTCANMKTVSPWLCW
jgi:hypothetical protein